MSTSTRIIKNSGYLYLKMAFTVFVNLYSTRLVLNALGVADFGIFGVIGSVLGMLGFLMAALASTTTRFINYYEGKGEIEKLKIVFNNSILLHVALASFLVVILELALPFLFDGILNIPVNRVYAAKMIYHFMVVSTFFSVITVPYDATINAHENMLYYAVTGLLESVAKLGIAFYLLYTLSDKLIIYGFLTAILSIFLLFIKQIYCRIKYSECRLNIKKYYDVSQIKDLANFSKWTIVSTGGIIIGNYGNNVVVNHFFGATINAAQSVSSQISGQVLALTNTMSKAMSPVIQKKAGSGDVDGMLKFALTGTKLNVFLYCILGIPFLVEAPFILKIWLKHVPDWTLCFACFTILSSLMEQFVLTIHTMLYGSGNIKEINIVNCLAHVVPLFLYVIIFSLGAQPYWLYIIYVFITTLIFCVADVHFCSKYCNLDTHKYLRTLLLPCLVCILISSLLGESTRLFLYDGWIKLFLSTLLVEISYFSLMYMIGFNTEERILINKMLHRVWIFILSKI
jgi:O-antigen/teichoic acid export membrane protein